MASQTITKPLRLILGQSSGYQSISTRITFVYERHDGGAWSFELENYKAISLMRFIDEGESEVVWESIEKGALFGGTKTEMKLKEIRIRRDFQTGKR